MRIPSPRRMKVAFINFGHKYFTGRFIGYALNSGGGRTGDLIIADGRDIADNVASEVHVTNFRRREEERRDLVFLVVRETPLQSARETSLPDEDGVADFYEAVRDAYDFQSMSGGFYFSPLRQRNHHCPSSEKCIDVARQTKTQHGQFGRD